MVVVVLPFTHTVQDHLLIKIGVIIFVFFSFLYHVSLSVFTIIKVKDMKCNNLVKSSTRRYFGNSLSIRADAAFMARYKFEGYQCRLNFL